MRTDHILHNAEKAIRVEYRIHHAPLYITALHNGEVATYQSPQMYPSKNNEDILIGRYEDLESAKDLLENSYNSSIVDISNTPFSQTDSYSLIRPIYGILIEKNVMEEKLDQIVLELQNEEFAVYTPKLDSYIYPHPSKVLENLDNKNYTRVLRSQYSIPRNIIKTSPRSD